MRNYFKETDQVVRRELRRIVRQPMYWVLMVVLPVVSFAFFAVIFERGVARNIPIAVLDEDHTTLSRKVTQMIDDTPTAMVSYEVQSMEEAQRLMRERRISAIVHIPAFFEKNILRISQFSRHSLFIGRVNARKVAEFPACWVFFFLFLGALCHVGCR